MIQFDSHSRGFAVVVDVVVDVVVVVAAVVFVVAVVVDVVVVDVVIVIEFDDKCGVITESDDA